MSLNPAEEWLPVVGWEGRYEVSNLGRVRSLRYGNHCGSRPRSRPLMLRPGVKPRGYLIVSLSNGRGQHATTRYVAHLVLEAFVGPCPDGMEAAHRDGVPGNNCLSNLMWKTHAANLADKVEHDTHMRGARHHNARLDEAKVRAIRAGHAAGESFRSLAAAFDILPHTAYMIATRRRWSWL